MNINKAIILGRITSEVVIKTTPTGANVASFSVATNKIYKDASGQKKETAEFHNVVLWQKLAELAKQYLVKGQEVYIEGRIQTRSYQDKAGVTKYRTEIIGEVMQFGAKPLGQRTQTTAQPYQAPNQATGQVKDINLDEDEKEVNIDDIPF